MASEKHNFIVSALVRKIRVEGFRIIYLDGKYQDVNDTKYGIPPKIINHRPDVIGEKENKNFCVGEAKTKSDLFSLRTINQFKDFFEIVNYGVGNRLYIGIPFSAKKDLNKLFDTLNIDNLSNVDIIYVPDELLPCENEIHF